MPIDLETILCAVVAVVILWRLWSVLGTRNEDEIQRPNPFIPPSPPLVPPQSGDAPFNATPRTPFLLPAPPPASLAGALAQVKTLDPAFDERAFLQQARTNFTAIVEAYGSGMLDTIATLLSPALLAHFQQSVAARRAAGQSAQSRVLSIEDAETTAARTEGTQAFITVTFTSTQENILRDISGKVIGGTEGTSEKVTDIWTFARDTQTPDSPWALVETRG